MTSSADWVGFRFGPIAQLYFVILTVFNMVRRVCPQRQVRALHAVVAGQTTCYVPVCPQKYAGAFPCCCHTSSTAAKSPFQLHGARQSATCN